MERLLGRSLGCLELSPDLSCCLPHLDLRATAVIYDSSHTSIFDDISSFTSVLGDPVGKEFQSKSFLVVKFTARMLYYYH